MICHVFNPFIDILVIFGLDVHEVIIDGQDTDECYIIHNEVFIVRLLAEEHQVQVFNCHCDGELLQTDDQNGEP